MHVRSAQTGSFSKGQHNCSDIYLKLELNKMLRQSSLKNKKKKLKLSRQVELVEDNSRDFFRSFIMDSSMGKFFCLGITLMMKLKTWIVYSGGFGVLTVKPFSRNTRQFESTQTNRSVKIDGVAK